MPKSLIWVDPEAAPGEQIGLMSLADLQPAPGNPDPGNPGPDPDLPDVVNPQQFFRRYRRGINMNGLELNWSVTRGHRWGRAELEGVKAFGFDHIRLPANAQGWWRDPDRMRDLDQRIDWALDLGLGVMLDPVHHHDALTSNPDGNVGEFRALWGHMAQRYKDLPQNQLCFDLWNEPKIKDAGKLASVYRAGLEAVRGVSSTRICGYGDTWDGVWVPDRIQHPDDDFTFLAAHIYLVKYDHETAVTWPYGNNQVPALEQIGTWENRIKDFAIMAEQRNRAVHVGEFGFKRSANPSKEQFLNWHLGQYDKYGWSCAFWTYYAEPFGARTLDYRNWESWADALV